MEEDHLPRVLGVEVSQRGLERVFAFFIEQQYARIVRLENEYQAMRLRRFGFRLCLPHSQSYGLIGGMNGMWNGSRLQHGEAWQWQIREIRYSGIFDARLHSERFRG